MTYPFGNVDRHNQTANQANVPFLSQAFFNSVSNSFNASSRK